MIQTTTAPPSVTTNGRFRTAAEWWDALGNVPLERIVFDPWPGTATEADVVRLDDHQDILCELIDGTLVEKTMGYEESAVAMLIGHILLSFVVPRKLGIVTGEAGMMRILARRVRIPDVAFVSFDRLPGRKAPAGPIPDLAPDLAVEVLSDSNTRREMENKLHEYFTAGTKLVWYVDIKTKSVEVYTSPAQITRLTGGDVLGGGEVLPGFEIAVSKLFEIA
ncbi:MAG: Uma2 family endonuclease [Tepidisphaeraceae bacterium]|jgi:Uma2 family endonuclease